MSASSLYSLPSEIIWKVITLLDPLDLSNARLVSKQLRAYCDHPANWRHVILEPPASPSPRMNHSNNNNNTNHDALTLWNLPELKAILQPHLALIQTIEIWGVRDNIIRFLILHCHKLEELTISGWSTLSDHALRIPPQPNQQLCLRRLRLVGQQKSNFTSLDATTFGKLISRCPHLEELSVVSCQIHIQADSLLESFDPNSRQDHHEQQSSDSVGESSSLKSLTVATKRTWSVQHVTRLFQLCSSLRFLALVPDSKSILESVSSSNTMSQMDSNLTTTSPIPVMENNQPLLEKNIESIEEPEMMDFDNIVVYSL